MRKLNNNLNIIACIDKDCGLGKDGKIPWDIKEDMLSFIKLTRNSVCIMGRRTYNDMYDMLIGRMEKKNESTDIINTDGFNILTGRQSFVVSNDDTFNCPGATKVKSIRNAIESLPDDDSREVFVIGGYRMFVEAFSNTKTVYLNIIKNKSYDCDVFFPVHILNKKFKLTRGEETDELYKTIFTRAVR